MRNRMSPTSLSNLKHTESGFVIIQRLSIREVKYSLLTGMQ